MVGLMDNECPFKSTIDFSVSNAIRQYQHVQNYLSRLYQGSKEVLK